MFELCRRKVNPGGCKVSQDAGRKIQAYFRANRSQARKIGLEFRAVTFADHRSGWQALMVTVSLWWWTWEFCPVKWDTLPREDIHVLSLADQIRRDHPEYDPEAEEREEREERRRLRKLERAILDEAKRREQSRDDEKGA